MQIYDTTRPYAVQGFSDEVKIHNKAHLMQDFENSKFAIKIKYN